MISIYVFKLCKKIAECLIDQRRHIEHLRQSNASKFAHEKFGDKLEKIYVLIEFLKKKINLSFEKNKKLLLLGNENDESANLANTSITESLKKIDYFLSEAETKLDDEFEIIEASQLKDVFSKETAETLTPSEDTEAQLEAARVEAERAEAERLDAIQREAEEEKRRQEEQEKEELAKSERLKKEIEQKLRAEYEAKLKQDAIELKLKEQLAYNKEQNVKVLKLIQTMRSQKWEHTRLNMDTLKEQFDFIQTQLKQVNYEIGQISKLREKRLKGLGEFHDVVLNFDKFCDIKSFTAQFNVFYWLFQQQPSMGEYFLHQQQQQIQQQTHFKTRYIITELKRQPKNTEFYN